MIRARMEAGGVIVTADPQDAALASRLPGATHTAKMPPFTWRMPLVMEAVEALRDSKVLCSPELASKASRMLAAQRYVERQKEQKAGDAAAPLVPPPMKPGIQLYAHQIRAYNIALALMGYDVTREDDGK